MNVMSKKNALKIWGRWIVWWIVWGVDGRVVLKVAKAAEQF